MIRYLLVILIILNFLNLESYSREIIVIDVDGGIGPGTSAYIEAGISEAEESNAVALILKLNTPGGLLESTRDIVQNIMESKVPIVVYVAPGGARAGSAGVFITVAANIAAMAPGTNIGAAHPVGMNGESDSNSVMTEKVTNDAAAFIRSVAEERGRNIDWAERTVRESISSTEREALEAGAIDLISPSLDSLIRQLHGMVVFVADEEYELETEGAEVVERNMNWREDLLSFISDPNIAYLFLIVGFYGILFEFYSPGTIVPGVLGAISIFLAAYSLQMLPVNSVGLGLIILSMIMFIVDVFVQSYGILSIGGIISLLLGSIMLIDSPGEIMEISMSLILTVTIATAVIFLIIIYFGVKSQVKRRSTGDTALVGMTGTAKSDIAPNKKGNAHVYGELWKAESDEEIKSGETIEVLEVKGFTIKVKKKL